jgi:hypothetical protein
MVILPPRQSYLACGYRSSKEIKSWKKIMYLENTLLKKVMWDGRERHERKACEIGMSERHAR